MHNSHNFINKYTAFAVLLLIVGCFSAGYFVGKNDTFGMQVVPLTMSSDY